MNAAKTKRARGSNDLQADEPPYQLDKDPQRWGNECQPVEEHVVVFEMWLLARRVGSKVALGRKK